MCMFIFARVLLLLEVDLEEANRPNSIDRSSWATQYNRLFAKVVIESRTLGTERSRELWRAPTICTSSGVHLNEQSMHIV